MSDPNNIALKEFEEFWKNQTKPLLGHNSSEWFDKYYEEFYSYMKGYKSIADVGCGSGDFLIRMAAHFDRIIGIDYSQSMVSEAKQKIATLHSSSIEVYCDNALNAGNYIKEPVDVLFTNNLLQYLTLEQIDIFVKNSQKNISKNGILLLMNIPDYNCKVLYDISFYHQYQQKRLSGKTMVYKIFRLGLYLLKKKLLNPKFKQDDGIGFWHTKEDLLKIAFQNNLKIDFFYSKYPPYGYRFHAKLYR
jgi:cyclopropane-fatty-acyl-phospholipid synthase